MDTSWARALLLSLAIASAAVAGAQKPGDLVVTPTRIMLDDRAKSGDITLVNRGSETVRYRLSLVDMEMSPDGVLRRVQGIENSAVPVLRLSPREVVLEPGASQRIKIAVSFPGSMPDKELRSHLAFEPIAIPRMNAQASEGSGLRLSFDLRTVVTIPVIAQHGRLSAFASITDAVLAKEQGHWTATLKLSRTGARTLRGNLKVLFVPANGGAKVILGEVTSLPVYFPNPDRKITVRLTRDVRNLGKGEIQISFVEPERSRGAATARVVVELPG